LTARKGGSDARGVPEECQDWAPSPDALRIPPVAEAIGLTQREYQVILVLCYTGFGNADIGRILGLTDDTVKTHIRNMGPKLGAYNRTRLAIEGFARGIVALPDRSERPPIAVITQSEQAMAALQRIVQKHRVMHKTFVLTCPSCAAAIQLRDYIRAENIRRLA
jgi:DNA-binding CsgD family transcriptional regulator